MTRDSYKDFSKLEIIKSLILFSLFLYFSFFLSKEFSDCILHRFSFATSVILPTVFPFMVISDFAISEFEFQKSAFLRKAFERWFKINGIGICAFVSGIIGGFPIGAKNAIDLFENGKISKCECERLMCFANLPGPAYVISAIGISILSSFKEGIVIYFSVLASAVICGKIIGIKKRYSVNTSENTKQKFVFM